MPDTACLHVVLRASGEAERAAAIGGLAGVLRCQKRLVDELIEVARRQRFALVNHDIESAKASFYAFQRVLCTLLEASHRRRAINRILEARDRLALEDLDDALGAQMTDDIRAARDDLAAATELLVFELEPNRCLVRRLQSAERNPNRSEELVA